MLIYNLKGEQDMNFSEFINKSWDKYFCKTLALEARHEIHNIMNEMSMAGGEAPRMPILYDQDDYRFLQQFPTEIWSNALKWRYNDGLRKLLDGVKDPHHIPDGDHWNWTDSLTLPSPSRPGTQWRFGKEGGPKSVYIGLNELAHKLTDPPKEHRGQSGEGKAYWKGDGPAIGEINSDETDKNHPTHPSQYKHGLYNFDLSGGVNIDPDDIDAMTDYEIMPLLPEKIQELVPPGTEPKDVPEVKKAIEVKKARMKTVLKHTFSGYDVLQKDRATESLGNWVRANGAPGNLFGEYPKQIKDPYTGQTHDVTELKNPHDIQELVHGRWGLNKTSKDRKTPMTLGTQSNVPITVPVYKKEFKFDVIKDGKVVGQPKDIKEYIPVLNPSKALPQIKLSDAQKEEIEKRTGKKIDAPGDLQGLLNIWDVLTPEQTQYLKDKSRTLFQVAQTKWNNDPDLNKYDTYADTENIYGVGHNPNHKDPERVSFSVKPEQTKEFIDAYKGKIFAQVLGNSVKGGIGDDDTGGQGGKINKILHWMRKSGKYPEEVLKALEDNATELAEYATYMLLGFLDDPRYGIKDDKFGLLKGIPAGKIDPEANRLRRDQKVYNFITSVAQLPIGSLLSRKRREKYGVPTKSSFDAPTGEGGESGAGNIASGQKIKAQHINTDAKRSFLKSQEGSMVLAGHKTHAMYQKMHQFLGTKRNYILDKLHNDSTVAKELKSADDKISSSVAIAQQLYAKYDAELAKDFPDDAKRDAEVMKKVSQELPAAIAKATGNYSDKDHEDILSKLKNIGGDVGLSSYETKVLNEKAKEEFDAFWKELIHKGEARVPYYDSATNDFKESPEPFGLDKIPVSNPNKLIQIMKTVYTSFPTLAPKALEEIGPKLYSIVQMYYEVDKDEGEDEKDFLAALATTAQTQASPAVSPPPPPAAAPAAHQPMNLAAKSVGELVAAAPTFNSRDEFIQIVSALLGKGKEFLADKNEAKKLNKMAAGIRDRMKIIGAKEPLQQSDYDLLKRLGAFIGDIDEKLDL